MSTTKKNFPKRKQKKISKKTGVLLKPSIRVLNLEPNEVDLRKLLEYYKNGDYTAAEILAKALSEKFPKHSFSWEILGAVLKKTGRIGESALIMQKIVLLSPYNADAHYNLGVTLGALGRIDEAAERYSKAIELNPRHAEAHNNFGNCLLERGSLNFAEASYRHAISLKPVYVQAISNLVVVLQQLGKNSDAEAVCRRSLALLPNEAKIHYSLAMTILETGKKNDAEASLLRAIELKPDYAEAHCNLGLVLEKQGRLNDSQLSYRRAIALRPDYATAYCNLGVTLQKLGRQEEAEAIYRKAIALKPARIKAKYLQSAEPNPHGRAHFNLANLLTELGKLQEARANYLQALTINPQHTEAHVQIALIKKYDTQDEQFLTMLNLYSAQRLSAQNRCQINFALAKAYGDLGEIKSSFKHYNEGNALRKKSMKYDIKDDFNIFKKIKNCYPTIFSKSLEMIESSTHIKPVFILGMPRSGTTLVEQIISSHFQVTGAGELEYLSRFGLDLSLGRTPINRESLIEVKERYLRHLATHANGNPMVTDKMPQNFYFIGLIYAIFPQAKIVHVNRDPAAVCWANYTKLFARDGIGYSYCLKDVVNYYKLYKNLMNFWETTFGNKIYNLKYELLTTDQDNETRKLIDYLELKWDQNCLEPENNGRIVSTSSNAQVRKKMYRGSSEAWRVYQPFLRGALDELS